MSELLNYLECWTSVATSLFSQALAGEPTLSESLPTPMPAGSFGFAATLAGEDAGQFAVILDGSLLEAPLLGDGEDQKAGWAELLKEVAEAAAGELLAKTGRSCHVTEFKSIDNESRQSRSFALKAGDRTWTIQVHDAIQDSRPTLKAEKSSKKNPPAGIGKEAVGSTAQGAAQSNAADRVVSGAKPELQDASTVRGALSPGLELLLDVELEASLRFGAREMPLGEILDLGPGDVVQLDRHITDPVELIIGDKIVARGEVVLVDGNFGLRVTEVAEPQSRLESIRCLF